MTFNVFHGGSPEAGWTAGDISFATQRWDAIVNAVVEGDADVVGFIEEYSAPSNILNRLRAIDPNWNRINSGWAGRSIYSRLPATDLGNLTARIDVGQGQSFVFHDTWWTSSNYGPFEMQRRIINDGNTSEASILAYANKGNTYRNTYNVLKPYLRNGERVVLGGDFNEASHQDWSANYEQNGGQDRWVNNASSTPITMEIQWKGSHLMENPNQYQGEIGIAAGETLIGMVDAYREHFPDEVAKPGGTWTPPYANGTPGRRPYDADPNTGYGAVPSNQVDDRIDRIYFAGPGIRVLGAAVVGEEGGQFVDIAAGDNNVPGAVGTLLWGSDHRAVVTTLEITAIGDLNFDGEIDPSDWSDYFRLHQGESFSGMRAYDTYALGDLDGDIDNDIDDFAIFKNAYNSANGTGALEALMAVPEPSTISLVVGGIISTLCWRHRRHVSTRTNFSNHSSQGENDGN